MVTVAREHPIEELILKASQRLWEGLEGEPTQEALEPFRSLQAACEMALRAIMDVDSKCRPTHEWMAALELVEEIKQETIETIELLENL